MVWLFLVSCVPGSYTVYRYDNREDIYHDGMRRIVNKHGRIGYANQAGKVVVKPKYVFGYPFENGHAKVTKKGMPSTPPPSPGSMHPSWESNKWYYIDKQGKTQKEPAHKPDAPSQSQTKRGR